MPCSSPAEVDRVMALNRWHYKDFHILADSWIENAGRSSVMRSLGEVWVRIDGIPLHLRSDELLEQLGKFCGEVSRDGNGAGLGRVCLNHPHPHLQIPKPIPAPYPCGGMFCKPIPIPVGFGYPWVIPIPVHPTLLYLKLTRKVLIITINKPIISRSQQNTVIF
ncbi:unnamed protein product [Linum tenue]|uniref:DUF4283 domain-containing protein n=1 Tax=Linum tenue TaxID=586396 RepID=A0AAV0N2C0_9ROSI|nr:unnamed protein product [Linum tenue]